MSYLPRALPKKTDQLKRPAVVAILYIYILWGLWIGEKLFILPLEGPSNAAIVRRASSSLA